MSMEEKVLVVPTKKFEELGSFQGFVSILKYDIQKLNILLAKENISYLPRYEVEENPAFKQIIPCAVFSCEDKVYNYRRGKSGTEARLKGLRSICVGGHVNFTENTLTINNYNCYIAMMKEIHEELEADSSMLHNFSISGLVNDDSNNVGKVHLGIVYQFYLRQECIKRKEDKLEEDKFTCLGELQNCIEEFETWGQLILRELVVNKHVEVLDRYNKQK